MYTQSFNYLVLVLVVVLVTLAVILLLLLLSAVKTFFTYVKNCECNVLCSTLRTEFWVYQHRMQGEQSASKRGLNLAITSHIRPGSELRIRGPLPFYTTFMVQFLSREIFIYIIIVVVFVTMTSVIIVTGTKEIRIKVAKIFRLAEAGPVQSLSFFLFQLIVYSILYICNIAL